MLTFPCLESWLKAEKSYITNIGLLANLKNTEKFKRDIVGPEIVSIEYKPLHNHRIQQVYKKLWKKYGREIVYIKVKRQQHSSDLLS